MILRPTSPTYNLALEEAIYRTCDINTLTSHLFVWMNYPSIIAGRLSKDGLDYSCTHASKMGIPVYRRFTGGGAVYHDNGVLSITIIGRRVSTLTQIYKIGAGLITALLGELGVEARIANEGDIVVGECKVSGSAAHLSKDRFLYHATLIVNSDLKGVCKLTPPRIDRVSSGEVDPVKYNPCPLDKLLGGIRMRDILEALAEVSKTYGRKILPLSQGLTICRESRRAFLYYLKRRVEDEYWNPCG